MAVSGRAISRSQAAVHPPVEAHLVSVMGSECETTTTRRYVVALSGAFAISSDAEGVPTDDVKVDSVKFQRTGTAQHSTFT